MAVSLKKPSKSETLTIRLDPKTRFMLEFVSRLRGQTITTVVERAITEAAGRALIEPRNEYDPATSWKDYWSVSDAERALNLASLAEVHPTFEEERRLDFTRRWWRFFYEDSRCLAVDRTYADVLWPDIDNLVEIEIDKRNFDAAAAGFRMEKTLREANLEPPKDWMPDRVAVPF